MKNPVAVFAGIFVVVGLVTANLWHELHAERQITDQLRARLADAQISSSAMAAAMQAQVTKPEACGPRAAAISPLEVPSAAAAPAVSGSPQNSPGTERDLLKDPEYRKARIAQQRALIQNRSPGLAKALGLTDDEATRLFDLLGEKQLDMNAEFALPSESSGDLTSVREMARNHQALQKQQENAARAMLGDDKYRLWQDYEQTRGPRIQAISIGTQLAQSGHPLSDTQQQSLTTALISEQQRNRQELQNTALNFNPNDPQSRAQLMDEALKRQEESNQRVVDVVSSSLDSAQIAALRRQYEAQMALTVGSQRMARARMDSQGSQAVAVLPGANAGRP